MTVQLSLYVNDTPIKTDYFVEGFIDHVTSGMIESLEGTGKIKNLILSIDGDKVSINLNGAAVPVNEFVTKIIKSTFNGMLAPLKGVSMPINRVTLTINK